MKIAYKTTATSTGGREGQSKTADGTLDLKLSTPKELGGAGGDGTNPEQLFASGYSACFLGALKVRGGQGESPHSGGRDGNGDGRHRPARRRTGVRYRRRHGRVLAGNRAREGRGSGREGACHLPLFARH